MYKYIVVHPGQAHRDDVMSLAFLLAEYPDLQVFRRNPTAEELDDGCVLVVDIGDRYEPNIGNFDHHQWSRASHPTCALTLVLRFLRLYELAKQVLPWIELTEVLDSRGPTEAAKLVGCGREQFQATISPVEGWLTTAIGDMGVIQPNNWAHEVLVRLGQSYIAYLDEVQNRWLWLERGTTTVIVKNLPVLLLTDISGDERPTLGLEAWLKHHGYDPAITVTCDDRGPGLCLYRRNDHPRVDFSRLAGRSDIEFTASGGFITKTKTKNVCLGSLLALAISD